ncbi:MULTISPECIES: NAD(P)-binding domain-containing protein [unclassified Streptomyces]|uniref:NAD(P)-binding domain-containing protein n=1 Tax=unclassified Streptomyces TaxID=2593676 RepID=UPI0033C7CF29
MGVTCCRSSGSWQRRRCFRGRPRSHRPTPLPMTAGTTGVRDDPGPGQERTWRCVVAYVGFVGLGVMGQPMTLNLARGGLSANSSVPQGGCCWTAVPRIGSRRG